MALLTLSCFGQLQVALNGEPVTDFQTDKVRALLIYLALEAKPHTRTDLAEFLWPGYSTQSANNSLRQTLHRLRQLLKIGNSHQPWLLSTRQTIQLNPEATVTVDVASFRELIAQCTLHDHIELVSCAACLARLQQAVALYRGDFLTDFTVADSNPFEEWRRITQELLHLQALDALTQLSFAAEATGDDNAVLLTAQRQLTLEPWRESAHRHIMRVLARRGQPAAAIAQYEQCRQVMTSEFDSEPAAETTALYEQIRSRHQLSAVRAMSSNSMSSNPIPPAQAVFVQSEAEDNGTVAGGPDRASVGLPPLHDWREMPTVPFFMGRAAEVAQLRAWLVPEGQNPSVRLISILGLGGMGKTTLAAHVVKAVAPSFTVVLWRSLLNAPPLGELLSNWLQTMARQHLTTIPQSLDEQLRMLFDFLRQERCLLVLDNVETLFVAEELPGRAGTMRADYEGYDQLLQRLATNEHQSVLLLTTREQPALLNRLGRQVQGERGQIRVFRLGGMDQQAGMALLQSNGLIASADEASTLVEYYSGNPLALQIAAATIADFFGGDVAAFRREEAGLFDGIQLVLDQQFARLTSLERDTLIWLAIERQEATLAILRNNVVYPVPVNALLEALLALQSRSLVETRSGTLTLPNVIIEYTTDYFVEQIYQELIGDALTQGQWKGQGQGHRQTEAANQLGLGAFEHPLAHSFLNRFAFFKAQAKEYVRQSQQRFILQPLADRLLANVGKTQLLATVQQLLRILRQATSSLTSSPPGYAAGNLLNLLLYLEVELAAYDFSELQIWQAHLRNKNAAGLRLTGAQLRDPTFSDNFSTILAMAFHSTDELLATGVHDGTIYLWQTKDWQRAGLLHGHTNAVRSLAFAPSAATADAQSLLASGGGDGRICLWHLEDGHSAPTYTLQREGYVRALAFCLDGAVLVSGSDDQLVSFWQVATGELRQQCRGHRGRIYGICSCAPLSGGPHQGRALIFSAGEDANIYVWDANSGEQVAMLAGHQHPIHALACVSIPGDGAHDTQRAWLASADVSGLIYLWNLQTFSLHYHWHEDRTVIHTLSFNATGTLLASASDNGLVRIWELGEGRLEKTIQAHPRAVIAAIFSARSPFLLATCGYDHLIRLWNGANGQALQVLHGFRNKSYVAHFQPAANNLLATGHTDGIVRLWQVDNDTPRLQRQLIGHRSNVFTLAFSPDGTRLATGSSDATIRLWHSATGEHLHTLYGHTQDIFSVAFSPDGHFLVSTSADQTIRLWETAGGCEVRCFAHQGCSSWSAVFHPNSEWVASGDFDYQMRLWEVTTGRLLRAWPSHQWEIEKVAFSPDGATLASAGHDGTVRLWDVTTGVTQRILRGHTAPLWSVAFSPDGRRLVSCGEDLSLRIWDLAAARDESVPCQILTGHREEVFTAVFHPAGHTIVSASGDGSVCFWDATTGALRNRSTVPGPYAGMKITGVTGISEAQKAALRALGAVE